MTLSVEYGDLSRRFADHGDHRLAQLAAWAADVHALEELLWENGVDRAPDPAAELAAVGGSVAASIEEAAAALAPGAAMTLRGVVETARAAMVATFDPSVHGLLHERFPGLEQLDGAASRADGADRASRAAARLEGRSPAELSAELRTAAGDCATMAGLLAAAGEPDAARRLSRQADAAAFEAYLVDAAVAAGDDALATADLRWELAAAHGSDVRRDRLAAVVGSAEREIMLAGFEPETPAS